MQPNGCVTQNRRSKRQEFTLVQISAREIFRLPTRNLHAPALTRSVAKAYGHLTAHPFRINRIHLRILTDVDALGE